MDSSAPLDPYGVLQVLPTADDAVIRAAYRALAAKYHPDRDSSEFARLRMRELNLAYDVIKTPGGRAAFDRRRRMASAATQSIPMPGRAPTALTTDLHSTRLTFGRYAGWTLTQIARFDLDYLRWLGRHSSGMRYKAEIDRLLQPKGVSTG